jgi:hypothetical protein
MWSSGDGCLRSGGLGVAGCFGFGLDLRGMGCCELLPWTPRAALFCAKVHALKTVLAQLLVA